MHNEQEIKLLTEAYMVMKLGNNENVFVKDIIWFKKLASGEDIDPESIVVGDAENRLVNRYMQDLKGIGALSENARRELDDERNSYISSDKFLTDLKSAIDIPGVLRPLYRVAKVLNTSMDENDPGGDSAFYRFLTGYFRDEVETIDSTELLYQALNVIKEMFEIEVKLTGENPKVFKDFQDVCGLFKNLKYAYGYEPIFNEED